MLHYFYKYKCCDIPSDHTLQNLQFGRQPLLYKYWHHPRSHSCNHHHQSSLYWSKQGLPVTDPFGIHGSLLQPIATNYAHKTNPYYY